MKEEEAGDLPFTTARLSRLGFDPNLSRMFEHDLRRPESSSQLSMLSWPLIGQRYKPSDWLMVTKLTSSPYRKRSESATAPVRLMLVLARL